MTAEELLWSAIFDDDFDGEVSIGSLIQFDSYCPHGFSARDGEPCAACEIADRNW